MNPNETSKHDKWVSGLWRRDSSHRKEREKKLEAYHLKELPPEARADGLFEIAVERFEEAIRCPAADRTPEEALIAETVAQCIADHAELLGDSIGDQDRKLIEERLKIAFCVGL
jgi:hypothetical protein